MANLTVVIDDQVLRRARIRALEHGTSVNALLRDYLAAYADADDATEAMREFVELANAANVRGGATWTRDEVYDRPVMRRG